MAGILTAAVASTFGANADPYFEYTTLLLPGNGTNGAQNNTFLDGSTNNFTITRNGNTTQGTFSPFSQTGWGNYFDGTGDYLSIADNAALEFGSSDFTLEFWYYPIAEQNLDAIITKGWPTLTGSWLIAQSSVAGRIDLYASTNGSSWDIANAVALGTGITLNAWHHVVMTRSGNTLGLFVDGVRGNTVNVTAKSFQNNTSNLTIGAGVAGSNEFNGYISNLRMVVGSSVYDPTQTTLTVPTSPLTAITNTSLLTCQSNRFIDNSTNNFTITRNGDTRVVAFSPFNPTASWSAATYGGSGYFDGSADFLTGPTTNAAFDFGAGPFTIEFWIYPTSFGATQTVVTSVDNATASALAFGVQITTSGAVQTYVWNGSSYFIDVASNTGVVKLNAWNYVAVVRSGANFGCFVNGTREGSSTTISGTQALNRTLNVGRDPYGAGSSYVFGYLSNIRIVKGTAVYDPTQTSITVPTAPLTAITNTSLLLNFANAGIYDATSKNDLETVGNAQISTTQSKWGGSSISFDGTGDWLLIPDQPPQRIGTGKFTIELWVYRNSSGTYGLVGKGTGTTGWLVSLNSSNQVVFTYASSTITSTGTVSATTWTHIAVVREGTSTNQTKIYINGTNDGTGTVSTDFNQTNSMYIGADRTGGSAANAYVQDVRITNDARYTANFTAPTAAFPTL